MLDFNIYLEIMIFGDAQLLSPVSLGRFLKMLSHLDISPIVFDCFGIYFCILKNVIDLTNTFFGQT